MEVQVLEDRLWIDGAITELVGSKPRQQRRTADLLHPRPATGLQAEPVGRNVHR